MEIYKYKNYIKLENWYFGKNEKEHYLICKKEDTILNNILEWIYNPFRKKYELYCSHLYKLDGNNKTLVKSVNTMYEVLEHCLIFFKSNL